MLCRCRIGSYRDEVNVLRPVLAGVVTALVGFGGAFPVVLAGCGLGVDDRDTVAGGDVVLARLRAHLRAQLGDVPGCRDGRRAAGYREHSSRPACRPRRRRPEQSPGRSAPRTAPGTPPCRALLEEVLPGRKSGPRSRRRRRRRAESPASRATRGVGCVRRVLRSRARALVCVPLADRPADVPPPTPPVAAPAPTPAAPAPIATVSASKPAKPQLLRAFHVPSGFRGWSGLPTTPPRSGGRLARP